MNPLLSTSGLSIGYGNQPIASHLDLSIRAGELICLLGPNGAGKSTLMRTLAGLQPALDGSMVMAGQASPFRAAFLARQVSVVLSGFEGISGLSAREYVLMGRAPYSGWQGRLSASDHEIVSDSLKKTDVHSLADRKLGTLSDGEQQRVMIARALAQQTPLILLDEPTSHLDVGHRVGVMQLLHQLTREQGKGILLSSHDLDLALQGADQIWMLSDSGTLTVGVPEDLILSGQLAKAYGTGGESYDWESGGLRLLPAGIHPINLNLAPARQLWMRRALARIGYREARPGEAAPTLSSPQENQWQIIIGEQVLPASSVAEVLQTLRNIPLQQ